MQTSVARRRAATAATLLLALVVSACATIGRDFPAARVPDIRVGETTQRDIRAMFGDPWRVGLEDGQRKWTYGKYRYRMFGKAATKDLAVRFDENGVVTSYSFNTTDAGELEPGDGSR